VHRFLASEEALNASYRGCGIDQFGSLLLLTNFGVWAFDSPYPRTLDGLITCYVAAIPFFAKTLQGDMLYTIILFGGFTLLEWRFSVLREPSIRSGMSLA
jgi:Family of unknown function (DUF6580)